MALWRPGMRLTMEQLNALSALSTYEPVITGATTNPNLGSGGERLGSTHRMGPWVTDIIRIRWDGTGQAQGAGSYEITTSHPVSSALEANDNSRLAACVGSGYVRNSTGSTLQWASAFVASSGRLRIAVEGAVASPNNPFNWASQGAISVVVTYPTDA